MEATMFTSHCPRCDSTNIQPHKNRPGQYFCLNCKSTEILASELKLKPIQPEADPHKDPRNKPTVYGGIS